MNATEPSIVFTDNLINRVFRTVEDLKQQYPSLKIFTEEKDLLQQIETEKPDIIFLNLDLAPNDAVLLSREIRRMYPASPPFIVIYSDKQDDFVQELAFNSGVDSYINFHAKPAVMKVFIRNLLKRKEKTVAHSNQKVVIDSDRYLIYKLGEPLSLPRKEFKLFELLYNNSDKFFSKAEIAETIWQDPVVAKKRAIDVHVYNIRQIFGKRIIQSQKGKGYRMNKKAIE